MGLTCQLILEGINRVGIGLPIGVSEIQIKGKMFQRLTLQGQEAGIPKTTQTSRIVKSIIFLWKRGKRIFMLPLAVGRLQEIERFKEIQWKIAIEVQGRSMEGMLIQIRTRKTFLIHRLRRLLLAKVEVSLALF